MVLLFTVSEKEIYGLLRKKPSAVYESGACLQFIEEKNLCSMFHVSSEILTLLYQDPLMKQFQFFPISVSWGIPVELLSGELFCSDKKQTVPCVVGVCTLIDQHTRNLL